MTIMNEDELHKKLLERIKHSMPKLASRQSKLIERPFPGADYQNENASVIEKVPLCCLTSDVKEEDTAEDAIDTVCAMMK